MWAAELRISSKDTLFDAKADECNVDLTGYPVSFYKEGSYFITFIARIQAENRNYYNRKI